MAVLLLNTWVLPPVRSDLSRLRHQTPIQPLSQHLQQVARAGSDVPAGFLPAGYGVGATAAPDVFRVVQPLRS